MPLCWVGECFSKLGFPVHAKRYLTLTLCEDALRECGIVSPNITGAYFRLIWEQGLPNEEFRRYARQLFELAEKMPGDAAPACRRRLADRTSFGGRSVVLPCEW